MSERLKLVMKLIFIRLIPPENIKIFLNYYSTLFFKLVLLTADLADKNRKVK